MPASSRFLAIAAGVVLLHGVGLWAIQAGLQRPGAQVIVPVSLTAQVLPSASPISTTTASWPLAADAQSPPRPLPLPEVRPATRNAPALSPLTELPPAAPVAAAAAAAAALQPVTPAPPSAAGTSRSDATPAQPNAPAETRATAGARIELPSVDASYLQNPKPAYPPLSLRQGEQGRVIVRVFIGTNGQAQKTEIQQSSGYDRLDRAALQTVVQWRYVPGKRNGTPEAMWFNIPLDFVLE